MSHLKIFVSLASPDDADVDWAGRFAEALRDRGLDVTEERTIREDDAATIEAAERGLRASDLIVSLVDDGETDSPNFWFEYGVAIAGGKGFVIVLPPGVDPERLPVPIRGGRFVTKGSPRETAAAVVAQSAERRSA